MAVSSGCGLPQAADNGYGWYLPQLLPCQIIEFKVAELASEERLPQRLHHVGDVYAPGASDGAVKACAADPDGTGLQDLLDSQLDEPHNL